MTISPKAPARRYGLRDRSTLKTRQGKLNSEYAQNSSVDLKDDEYEQIKRATEESLRDYQRQNSFEVTLFVFAFK